MDDFHALNAIYTVFGDDVRLICWPEGEWWVWPQTEEECHDIEVRISGTLDDDELRFSRFIDQGDDDETDEAVVGPQEA